MAADSLSDVVAGQQMQASSGGFAILDRLRGCSSALSPELQNSWAQLRRVVVRHDRIRMDTTESGNAASRANLQ